MFFPEDPCSVHQPLSHLPVPLPISQALVLALAGINLIPSSPAEAAVTVLPEWGVGTNLSSQLCLPPARAAKQRLGGLFRLALSADWLMSHLFASGYSALCRYSRGCFLPRVSPYPMGCKAAAETLVSCNHSGDSRSIHCSNRCLKGTLAVLLKAYSALPYLSFPRSDHPCVCFLFPPPSRPKGRGDHLPGPHHGKAGAVLVHGTACEGRRPGQEEREGLRCLENSKAFFFFFEELMRCSEFPRYFLEKPKPTLSKRCIVQTPLRGWEERVHVVYTH